MTTYTFTGFSSMQRSGDEVVVAPLVAEFVMPDDLSSLTYGVFEFADVGAPFPFDGSDGALPVYIEEGPFAVRFNGEPWFDTGWARYYVVGLNWNDGTARTTYFLAIEEDIFDRSFLLILGGDPLPELSSPADFAALEAMTTGFSLPAEGSGFEAGAAIELALLPGVVVTENDLIEAFPADEMQSRPLDSVLFGGIGNDTILGAGANDDIYGGNGDDSLDGGAGQDLIFGGSRSDTILGGDGDDRLYGEAASDTVEGGAGADSAYGGSGADWLYGNDGDDLLAGGDSFDRIFGGNGNDRIFGQEGGDILYGDAGNDLIEGGIGNDILFGGAGNDTLDGGAGDDRLTGSAGRDTFVFGAGADRITQFSDGLDVILLRASLFDATFADGQDVMDTFGSIDGGNAVLDFGDGNVLTINGVTDLSTLADDILIEAILR